MDVSLAGGYGSIPHRLCRWLRWWIENLNTRQPWHHRWNLHGNSHWRQQHYNEDNGYQRYAKLTYVCHHKESWGSSATQSFTLERRLPRIHRQRFHDHTNHLRSLLRENPRMFRSFFLCFVAASLACCLPHISSASSSSSAMEAVTPSVIPSFTLSAPTPGALTLIQGQAGMVTMSLTGNAAFYGEVRLTCSGANPGLQCLVSPAATTLGASQSRLATIAIATQGAVTSLAKNKVIKTLPCDASELSKLSGVTGQKIPPRMPSLGYSYWRSALRGWTKASGAIGLAGSLIFWIDTRRFRRGRWSAVRMLTLLSLVGGICASVTGCGSWWAPKPTATPLGVSTLTITATSGNISQVQKLTVMVMHP
jgi:hypothetical protein